MTTENQNFDSIIIGGGVAGLSALETLNKMQHNVLLLEKAERCGGLVNSDFDQDFLLETGPVAFLKSYKHTTEFIEKIGLSEEVITNVPGNDKRYIYRNGELHALPEGPLAFFKSKLFSAKAKLRLCLEPFSPRPNQSEESVYEFGKRRFGEEVANIALDSMVSGVAAGDFKKIDVNSLFPKIATIENKFKSFLLFLLLFKIKSTEKSKDNKSVTFRTLKKGMGAIARHMEQRHNKHIRFSCEALSITKNNGYYTIQTCEGDFTAKNIVLATPAFVAGKLLANIDGNLSVLLQKIPYGSITTCLMGYPKESIQHTMDGFGFLIPRNQKVRILGGLFSSNLFPDRAGHNHTAIKVYIGGAHDEDIQNVSDQKIVEIVHEELSRILKISSCPIYSHVNKIENAIPQYHLGHQSIKKSIYQALAKHPDIFLLGNYLEGISVNESIKSAENLYSAEKN
ncbi:MAG: protoporphyrinogen oxidase [Oligoflexia bacterium]|nr:protoporphyrinogen oxidase [Oligoflexia bacterium]MBF0367232.1 protoporphyrinogen oxidase [Oligoflexia bacterium]